jgi:hypothetical protein
VRPAVPLILVLCLLPRPGAAADSPRDEAETFFELKIRPTLAGTCFACHGGKKTSSGLRVDSREALLRGGESGPAIVPGAPEKSLLVQAIRHAHEEIKMPPGKKLPDAVAADFAAWVQQGAHWPAASSTPSRGFTAERHWAFEPVGDPLPPADPSGWADGPIDRFITAKWRQHGLKPLGQADRRVLLRRISLDLIGLPPTPEEVDAFLADHAPDALAKRVDRLLASPRYGERWGRHWMDVVRYADTAGDNADYPIPEVALYRDYIIAAFNADKPYDQFVREQVAGDILAGEGPRSKYAEQVIATGFLALSRRYATAPYELMHLTLEDTIETTGRAFLGLTLRCARCHDHKFDPVTTRDYYALYGIFASTNFPYAGSEEFQSMKRPRQHFAPLVPPDEAAPRIQAYRDRLQSLDAELKALEKAPGKDQAKIDRLRAEHDTLARVGLPPDLASAYAVSEGAPVQAAVQRGGDPANAGAVVPHGVIAALAGPSAPRFSAKESGRRELADWLTRPEHPLTARVMVNRIWQHHFGRGIVATPSNFGLRGAEPTHPELLDWLARRFIESGWSVKAMHRLIVLSRTYALAAGSEPASAAKDPGNLFLWRHDRQRLDAEALRDGMLSVSGRLMLTRPLPHPFPTIDQWHWTQHNAFKEVYPTRSRSVYLMTQRLLRHPYLALFDGPDTNHSTDVRTSSTVPLQSLYLMNNPFVREQSEAFADRLVVASPDPVERVALGYKLAWCRAPQPEETRRCLDHIGRYGEELKRAGAPADRIEIESWTSLARVLLTANEFLYVD